MLPVPRATGIAASRVGRAAGQFHRLVARCFPGGWFPGLTLSRAVAPVATLPTELPASWRCVVLVRLLFVSLPLPAPGGFAFPWIARGGPRVRPLAADRFFDGFPAGVRQGTCRLWPVPLCRLRRLIPRLRQRPVAARLAAVGPL